MIPGTNVTLGGQKYLIPPLNFAALKKHKPFLIRAMKGVVDPTTIDDQDFDVMFDLVYLALKRNYPALTEEVLGDQLDLGNIQIVMPALMKTSGFEEVEAKAGE